MPAGPRNYASPRTSLTVPLPLPCHACCGAMLPAGAHHQGVGVGGARAGTGYSFPQCHLHRSPQLGMPPLLLLGSFLYRKRKGNEKLMHKHTSTQSATLLACASSPPQPSTCPCMGAHACTNTHTHTFTHSPPAHPLQAALCLQKPCPAVVEKGQGSSAEAQWPSGQHWPTSL